MRSFTGLIAAWAFWAPVLAAESSAVQAPARNLVLRNLGGAQWHLAWDYTNPGDTNQNGIVGIDDLTPLGAAFNRFLDHRWDDPLRNVDCDRNTLIGISDLTPIGANFGRDLSYYAIERSLDGTAGWANIATALVAAYEPVPTRALRFDYGLGQSFVDGAWYRVVPYTHDNVRGTPSEAVSADARMLTLPEVLVDGRTIVLSVLDLPHPLRTVNSCRMVYPASYSYVGSSFNIGSAGGDATAIDGLWADFVDSILFPPSVFLKEKTIAPGLKAIEFNITPVGTSFDQLPGAWGDVLNFRLRSDGSGEDLTLTYQETDGQYYWTYFTDAAEAQHFFGNSLMMTVR